MVIIFSSSPSLKSWESHLVVAEVRQRHLHSRFNPLLGHLANVALASPTYFIAAIAANVSVLGRSLIRSSCFSLGDRVSFGLDEEDDLGVNFDFRRLAVVEVDMMEEVSDFMEDFVEDILVVDVVVCYCVDG